MPSKPGSLHPRSMQGLSLQEMLIVVVVFAILALIVIFSSSQATVRTRLSRVKQEQQVLASALNAYRLDNSDYPSILNKLVAPIMYLQQVPVDPFAQDKKTTYTYYLFPTPKGNKKFSIIVSCGPDGDIDFSPLGILGQLSNSGGASGPSGPGSSPSASARDLLMRDMLLKSYDPTNGITSNGDVIRLD